MSRVWRARDIELPVGGRTLLMGVLNVTPDSFSDGGKFLAADAAAAHAREMVEEGADIIDVGGESTRPYGSVVISADDEWQRVGPVLDVIATAGAPVSIDTYKAETARKALELGVKIVNDVWGFQKDAQMPRVVAEAGAGAVLMHNRESADPAIDIVDDIRSFLERSVEIAVAAGVHESRIVLDPGIGFGKTPEQSAEAIRRLAEVKALGFPVLLGASRKRFIGHILGIDDPARRLYGTLAAHLAGVLHGADIIRVHDVRPHREALQVFGATQNDS
jgi:dihydropteroate synthase